MTNDKPESWSNVEPEKRRLALSTLRFSKETQPRESIDDEWVERYAERMQVDEQSGLVVDDEGEPFPPLTVFYDGDHYWVADGHHRGRAARSNDFDEIQVELYQGSKRDAVLYAASANAEHGKPRDEGDVRRIVLKLLLDDEWRYWSDREIARQCRVERSWVNEQRRRLMERDPEYREDVGTTRKYKVDGEVREMDTSNIGQNDDPDDSPVSWTLGNQASDSDGQGGEDDTSNEAPEGGDEGSDKYREEPNFQEMPSALECAAYAQYDVVSETTVASGGSIRECLDEIAPIDLMVSTGPSDRSAYSSWVEAAAHTLADDGVLVAILKPPTYSDAIQRLSKRLKHRHTQLLDLGQSWRLASFWHHSLGLGDRVDLGDRSWSDWASTLYQPTMSTIALPYAQDSSMAAGLIGPDRRLTILTDSKEGVDAISSNL